ncbi:hypothetical protein [Actinopolymorpha pittospori]|uniref:Glycoside hydrolase family 42 N-terminal domain-containing protein n=1 Tax=Actinopolymorpha pittospori TaxID=648752 RepID=A0A927RIF0_9ACTN|nr:hypothetical protein [Actinopolymorpha pittospori]MBE1613215.1 hypothetical protein [Actinopolymorpha pittospori]
MRPLHPQEPVEEPRNDLSRRAFVQRAFVLGVAGGSALSVPWLSTERAAQAATAAVDVDPWSFLVGPVRNTFTADTAAVRAKDLSALIDRDAKTIRSASGQLTWSYGDGVVSVDTPCTQGAFGFLGAAGRRELSDVVIDCANEYASIVVTALDGQPIGRSARVLVQAVTEEQPLGWQVEGDTITGVGDHPVGIRRIEASLEFAHLPGAHAYALDGNGYVNRSLPIEHVQGGGRISLPADTLYTVISRSPLRDDGPDGEDIPFVWWEGEAPAETNFPSHTEFSPTEQERHLLSGGEWLSNEGTRGADDPEAFARYDVDVAEEGEYHLWIRKFWHHGPFRWRFDEGEWHVLDDSFGLADNTYIRRFLNANWFHAGTVRLAAGRRSFELRLLAGPGEALTACFDAFLLTPGQFVPRGKFKPGEYGGEAAEGFAPFEVGADAFASSPIDLSHLNEDVAGRNGFVTARRGGFVLGDRRPVRFWAVNAGPEIVRQDPGSVDYLARFLAKRGVNLVRIHGQIFADGASDLSVDAHYLDQLHAFVAAMKRAGIYVNLSYYFPLWVQLGSATGFPGYDDIANRTPFALVMFDPDFQAVHRSWARALLTTPNPHTGLALAADPAVAMVEIQNEDSFFFWTFTRTNIPEVHLRVLDAAFGAFLARCYGSPAAALSAWGAGSGVDGDVPAEGRMVVQEAWMMTSDAHPTDSPMKHRMRDQREFLTQQQRGFYADTARYYREELGVRSLVTPSNWITAQPSTMDALERYTYTAGDVVDRHDAYFTGRHEGFGADYMIDIGQTFESRSTLRDPDATVVKFHRIAGHPQTVSETGWPNPNRFKAESVPLWAAYGALQGMGGIEFFALDRIGWQGSPGKFTTMVPSIFGQFPAYALAYRRGDIQEGEPVVDITHSLQELYDFGATPVVD